MPERPPFKKIKKKKFLVIDILAISKLAFKRYVKEKINKIFITNIYDIKQVI